MKLPIVMGALIACRPAPVMAPNPSIQPHVSAETYAEVVHIDVHNVERDFCLGVLIAPYTVLTAAHCVAFNPQNASDASRGTWTVTLRDRSIAARSFALFDPRMQVCTRETYFARPDIVDVAVLFLDAPTVSPASLAVAHVGQRGVLRQRVAPRANAALYTREASPIVARTAQHFQTARLTGPGDSGTPFFLLGTHQVLGIETRFDEASDTWTTLDGAVATWLEQVRR